MFLALAILISLGSSAISYKDSVLTISDVESIDNSQINQYSDATSCIITSDGSVSIQRDAFASFTSLAQLTIQVSTINFESQSFKQVDCIKNLTVLAKDSINIGDSAFLLGKIEYINLYAQNNIVIGKQSFQQTNTISQLNLYSNGTIEIQESAFMLSLIKGIHIESKGSVVIEKQAFQQCGYITTIEIESTEAGITFQQSSFHSSTLQEVIVRSFNDIIFSQQSMQEVTNFKKLTVETQGNFKAEQHSFLHSTINEFYIHCNGYATFEQQTFQQTPELTNFTVIANKEITFAQHSFLQSNVNSMILQTNSSITFEQQCFQQTKRLNTFIVNAMNDIDFGKHAFLGSNVNSIYINTTGDITFGEQCFQNCLQLTTFVIQTSSDVIFNFQAFHNSQVHELIITKGSNDRSNSVKLQDQASTITFEKQSFCDCEQLTNVDISTDSNVDIQSGSFKNSKSLNNVKIDTKGKATVASHAFSGCKSLDEVDITASDKNISPDAYADDDDEDGKKSGGSSHKDNDDDSQTNAKALGNIEIESAYLGTSPNVYLNLNFLLTLMKNCRKLFGHIIPSPEMVHSAIWVGKKDATDDTLGAIFVYGKYWNKKNLPSYIDRDGAKACVMSLREFKQRYPSINPMKLNLGKKLKLFDFIKEVKKSGNWRAADYNWPTNNCQHFTAKLINILEASRSAPNYNDWMDLPKPVLNSLELNEKQKN